MYPTHYPTDTGDWIDANCVTKRLDGDYVRCTCNHLSLFGVEVVRLKTKPIKKLLWNVYCTYIPLLSVILVLFFSSNGLKFCFLDTFP